MPSEIRLSVELWERLRHHFFPTDWDDRYPEEAAFGYAHTAAVDGVTTFTVQDLHLLGTAEFEFQSEYYFSLTDEAIGRQIKRAWVGGQSLVEFHCHRMVGLPAQFSSSDLGGFREIVPHLFWRLKGRPYAAVVVADESVDALAWVADGEHPESVIGIWVGDQSIRPTGLTANAWRA